jgi:hypothetical protein
MRIIITAIPHGLQRYETIGDYYWEPNGDLHIYVSDLGDDHLNFLIAIHEAVEAMLTAKLGIAEPDIMAFDKAHPELLDPGHDPRAPYHRQHVFAEIIERMVAHEMGINWQAYEQKVEKL